MWKLYDALIEAIPSYLKADEILCGPNTALVQYEAGVGYSGLLPEQMRPSTVSVKRNGMPLKDLASCVKSWNFVEAGIGLAAINAYYNALPVAREHGVPFSDARHAEDRMSDPFIAYQNLIRDKSVAVIGHFPHLEQLFLPVCSLHILEQDSRDYGVYPMESADYILPECQYVFLPCRTLVDKSLPRLLAAASSAHVVLVGPFTTLAPQLFSFGVSDLSGFLIKDPDAAKAIVGGMDASRIYRTGEKVSFKAPGR